MPKKNDAPASFETALSELEQIVNRLESGDLPLEEALNEFERGVQLARRGRSNCSRPSSACRSCCPTAKTLKLRHSHRTPSKWISPTSFRHASRVPTMRCAVLLSHSLFRTLHWLKPCTMAHSWSGKRLRPFLVYATGNMFGISANTLDAPAAAVECIHAYSLIHDDLPAMDDDDLRRGQPTCHIKFGEANAILAGDALQTLAFSILSDAPMAEVADRDRLSMISELAMASGVAGMCGGQGTGSGSGRTSG